MLKVALTGGIATGKSYVLERLRRLGVPVIDADMLVHDLFGRASAVAESVARRFGSGVINADGSVNREKLGAIVFADQTARGDLEGIVHPEVYGAIERWFNDLRASSEHPFAVADIPLLFETGHACSFDRVVATTCDPDVQVARIVARDHLTESAARLRLAAQWPSSDKAARADFVVDTGGEMQETDRQIDEVVTILRSG